MILKVHHDIKKVYHNVRNCVMMSQNMSPRQQVHTYMIHDVIADVIVSKNHAIT